MENKPTKINWKKEIIEYTVLIVISFIIAITVKYFIFTFTEVNMTSMVPTLQPKDRLLLNRTMRITKKRPKRGDIITFEAPTKAYTKNDVNNAEPKAQYIEEKKGFFSRFLYYVWEAGKISYIKRVIGLPGEKIKIEDGKIYVNEQLLDEQYLKENVITTSNNLDDFMIPEGYIFAMGDNRSGSKDCREFGCIPIKKIEGIATFRILPFSKFRKFKHHKIIKYS